MRINKTKFFVTFLYILSAIASALIIPIKVNATITRDVGIWYSTLYSAEREYIWNYGSAVNSQNKFTGDVNGDGRDDVVYFRNTGGVWHGLISDDEEDKFNLQPYLTIENQGHGQDSTKQFLADVNGDGYADAVAYWDVPGAQGVWRIWYNDKNGHFTADNTVRVDGLHGGGSIDQMMGDVNGDGAADAVIVTSDGDWHVAFGKKAVPGDDGETGFTLTYGGFWKKSFGAVANKRFLGDVTGDGKDDAIIITNHTGGVGGDWHVSVNSGNYGNEETGFSTWIMGHGVNSSSQFIADVNGDGKDDAIVMTQNVDNNVYGDWYVAYSIYNPACTSNCFDSSSATSLWLQRHGYSPKLQNYGYGLSNWQGFGDFDDDDKADPVVFHNSNGAGYAGEWRVMPSSWDSVANIRDPDQMNYWQANIIRYMPIVNNQMEQYDSEDTDVIDEHLSQIGSAGINFLLLDLTNGPQDWYYRRALKVCDRLQVYNQSHSPIKISLGIGGFQKEDYSNINDFGYIVEQEVGDILNSTTGFVNNSRCQGLMYNAPSTTDPMLTMYFSNEAQRNAWLAYTGDKSNSNQFNIKYTYGAIPYEAGNQDYACSVPNNTNPCDYQKPSTQPSAAEYNDFTGWGVPYGTLLNATNNTTAVVMPGWNTNKPGASKFISRNVDNLSNGFYKNWGWDKINNLSAENKPTMVIINSFNEYAEETAVAPTETDNVSLPRPRLGQSQQWPSRTYFWTNTASFISTYRQN